MSTDSEHQKVVNYAKDMYISHTGSTFGHVPIRWEELPDHGNTYFRDYWVLLAAYNLELRKNEGRQNGGEA